MIKDKLIDAKKIVSKLKVKLVTMIKDAGGKFDDYSISPKIRQILLHWGIVTRNNIVWKLACGYCLCYCKTFSLVPDSTE